jgi:hypothetical protein
MATEGRPGAAQAVWDALEKWSDVQHQRRLQQAAAEAEAEAEEQARAERDRALLDQLADRLMLEYRNAGEPPYSWLARDMQVSKATVCRILNGSGKTLPRWWQVDALLRACKVDAGTVFEIKKMWIDIRNEQKPIYFGDTEVLSGE